ncbi:hypothetical protein [Fulvimarina manganoxydans]|uniref:hypothetical protein n=1 Tax=Fulvimarina manganoxydans TaxID=937218 RepID=UPI0014827252|nr:hypothetical protein [Fulvimarina manganoxydans]
MTPHGIPFHGQLADLRANAPDRLLGRRLSIGTNARIEGLPGFLMQLSFSSLN